MLEMLSIIGPCSVLAAIVMTLAYWCCRKIDFHYRMLENVEEHGHELDMQLMADSDARGREMAVEELRYVSNKKLIQTLTDRTKMITMDVVKQINDSRYAQAKQMMGDMAPMMKDMMKAFEEELEDD